MDVTATDVPVGPLRCMTPVPEAGAQAPRRLRLDAGANLALDAVASGG